MTRAFGSGRVTSTRPARALTGLLLIACLVPGASRAATTIPTLAGVNEISASRASRLVVNVPRAARWECEPLQIKSSSRIAGLVLVRDTPDRLHQPLVAIRWPRDTIDNVDMSACPDGVTVPAGRYLLYVLADAPAKVVLRLKGLTGSRSLTAIKAARYQPAFPPPTLSGTPGNGVYSAGSEGTLRSNGFLYSAVWADVFVGNVAQKMGVCAYEGAPGGPALVHYGPGCLRGGFEYGSEFLLAGGGWQAVAIWGVPRGTYGLGGYYLGAGITNRAGVFSFWLSYD